MVVEGSRQEILDPGLVLLGTRQQGVSVILRELVLPDGFDPGIRSFFWSRSCTSTISTALLEESTLTLASARFQLGYGNMSQCCPTRVRGK
ncbi:unnamed protein product [Schistosoma curassoni]|uniref:Uncharacterized protein n=1 Tax=Schistosoma curassoni TaxID=6186 RepID=A0A183JW05_9TREM|nr:unnamed protein product [Schistosoma curassoni]